MFNRSAIISGLVATIALGQIALAQDADETPSTPDMAGSRYVIDHIFFFSDSFAPEQSYTEQHGFNRRVGWNTHTGQGTTGRFIYFDNVYLEYLWIDDAEAAENNIPSANSDFNARNRWREDPSISPFGIGLRDLREGEAREFETSVYTAEWMRGNFELYPAENAPDITEPWVFFLPNAITSNARDRLVSQDRSTRSIDHPNGARVVTAVTMYLPYGQIPSRTLQILVDDGLLTILHDEEHRIEIELDDAAQGRSIDMRDRGMPIIFHL